jgi:superfamily I DNA/RNA helicase
MLRDHDAKHILHPQLQMAVAKWLLSHKADLISDLPSRLLDGIKGGDFRDKSYSHVIVDEFQDLTPAEQQLVEKLVKLVKPDSSILVLGDPRQRIYFFRGNDRGGLGKLDEL